MIPCLSRCFTTLEGTMCSSTYVAKNASERNGTVICYKGCVSFLFKDGHNISLDPIYWQLPCLERPFKMTFIIRPIASLSSLSRSDLILSGPAALPGFMFWSNFSSPFLIGHHFF